MFNDVIIRPPYKVENISGHAESQRLTYVKKMVERLTQETQQPLPQRKNPNSNGPNQNRVTHSSLTTSSSKPSSIPNSNIKAN